MNESNSDSHEGLGDDPERFLVVGDADLRQ